VRRRGGSPSAGAWAVVPAAGRGVRMGRKKPGIRLAGRRVLLWTLDVLAASPAVAGVVVAVAAEDLSAWRRQLRGYPKVRAVVAGGAERQASVASGLAAVPAEVRWIIVHDGVRPCITPALVARVLAGARHAGAAIAALPIAETVKRAPERWVKETIERDGLWAVQTPQAFEAGLLREAYRRAAADGVTATDDAGLVERLGTRVQVVLGLPGNVKITRPEDLPLARALLAARRRPRPSRARPAARGRGGRA
jgi:2-C-methyl-D-erythritol 4-phosphate cytidylyltransferase